MPSIREEVTKTIRRLTRRSKPGPGPAAASGAQTVLRSGRQLESYRIIRPLGAGGMGQVYLALDTRLGRHVALKFLPPELTSDLDMFHLLEQEARTASALNHPNIVTIYEIGEFAGERFIASEYIDGVTLRTALERDSVDLSTALDVAMQVGSALVAAHAAGVTHRDIKPANIMIRPDGYIKVIDFGIAKLARQQAARGASSLTTSMGTLVGTVEYMSPEQARGESVDPRTDLWSLGILLYEMLAGQRPFKGKTESHIIVNILDNAPPAIPANRSVPLSVQAIVDRALAKERSERYQTAGEMLSDLHQAAKSSGVLTSPRRVALLQSAPVNKRRRAVAALIAAGVLISTAIWWWALDGKETVLGPDWFRIDSVDRKTFNGRTKMAAISPDGKYLAYVVGDPGGVETLYLRQTDSTSEEVKIPARKISYEGLTFSPNSLQIFAVEKDKSLLGKLYSVPIVGERGMKPLVSDIDGPVTFSPSGDRFAFVRYAKNRGKIEVAQSDGSNQKDLLSVAYSIFRRPAWSPDGDVIANLARTGKLTPRGGQLTMHLVKLSGKERTIELPGWGVGGQIVWTNRGKSIITCAATSTRGNNQLQIRELSVKSGQVHDITKDLAGYQWVSLTKDNATMAAVKLESKASIWVSRQNDFSKGDTSIAEVEQEPSLDWRDATHVLLNTEQNGSPNILSYDVNPDAHKPTLLTREPYVEQHAVAVPGSHAIVFASNRSGSTNIWRYDPDTDVYNRLTFGVYDDSPSVTPDGKSVVYSSWEFSRPELFKVPVAGGIPLRIGKVLAQAPVVSPTGREIACHFQNPVTQAWDIGVISIDGTEPFRIVPRAEIPFRWSPDGHSLTSALTDDKGLSNIWMLPIDGGAGRQVTHFEDQAILAFSWSPDGSRLACIRVTRSSDVVLFSRQK